MKILITESQLKYLVEQQVQSIDFVDECGKVKSFKSNSTEYSKFYHTNIKFYKWDGKKYNYVKTNIWPKWDTFTQAQKDQLLRARCSGSYKDQPNLITAAVKEIGSFANWLPKTIQDWVDWLTWFISWLGPSGAALSKIVKFLSGLGYLIFGTFLEKDEDKKFELKFEGVAQLLDVLNFKLKVPYIKDYITRIVNFFKTGEIGKIIQSLTARGMKLNTKFNSYEKSTQMLITLVVKVLGTAIGTVFDWIGENVIKPLYETIVPYNSTVGNWIKYMYDTIKVFASLVETAKLIIDDADKKGILNVGQEILDID